MSFQGLARAPKAVLHDHLDGGLRIATLIALAHEQGYESLPSTDPDELASAMHQGSSGSLTRYLNSFSHTLAVMQSHEAIERVAYEAGVDLADDGVVYAEVRFGPSLLTKRGLTTEQAIQAALDGLGRARSETGIELWLIVTALRERDDSLDTARAAAALVGGGVVGFDLAGPELGYPIAAHLPALRYAKDRGLAVTIHAGEVDEASAVAAAIDDGGADRIGHGVRIIDDCRVEGGEIADLGPIARLVHDRQIPLELAITSNLHIGAFPDAASHPFGLLYRAGFNVTINTDNRLMSEVTPTSELELAAATFDLTAEDLATITCNALAAGFGDEQARRRLRDEICPHAYRAAS